MTSFLTTGDKVSFDSSLKHLPVDLEFSKTYDRPLGHLNQWSIFMPTVSTSVPHNFTAEEVIQRSEPYIEKLVNDFEGKDFEIDWNGNNADFSFKSLAFKISGRVAVTDETIGVDVDLPFAAMMFKDKVQRALTKNLTRAVSDEPAPDSSE